MKTLPSPDEVTADTRLPALGELPPPPPPFEEPNVEPDTLTDDQQAYLDSIVGDPWSVAATVQGWSASTDSEGRPVAVLQVSTDDGAEFTITVRPPLSREDYEEQDRRSAEARAAHSALVEQWDAEREAWQALADLHALRDAEIHRIASEKEAAERREEAERRIAEAAAAEEERFQQRIAAEVARQLQERDSRAQVSPE